MRQAMLSAFAESERLVMAFAERTGGLSDADRRGELIAGGGFLVLAGALAGLHGTAGVSLATVILFVLALAAVSNARFDLGAGFTVPTQVVFVPMLFALPPSWAPALVVVSLAIGMAPAVITGQTSAKRLAAVPGNSWFAIGPALVLTAFGAHRPDAHWPVLLLALGAQLAGDLAANALRERVRGGISIAMLLDEAWRVYLLDVALAPLGVVVAIAAVGRPWIILLVTPLFSVMVWLANERRSRLEQLVELNNAYRGTALLLGDVVEADDGYTGAHCKDVVRLSLAVADELELDSKSRRNLEFGALLHDIGKIAVPKHIINKPGKLSADEWQIIKTHTIEGHNMLKRVGGVMGEVGKIVRSHHERWDGGGYPDRLHGLEIPIEARIISCCDAYNAMTTTRSYRAAMPIAAATAEVERNAGTQFDPRVVRALAKAIAAEA
jgi:putative nucleotidyltransferase with HDIG domain